MKKTLKMSKLLLLTACLFFFSFAVQAIEVKGVVNDTSGDPLIGVYVSIKGKTVGTITDIDGKYAIQANMGEYLVFSYVGFKSQTIKVTSEKLNVTLNEEATHLDEMVVVAHGSYSRNYSAPAASYTYSEPAAPVYFQNSESYQSFTTNKFMMVNDQPLSTFSIDVDKASYANMRRFIENGQIPPADAIRVEELINYFKYDYSNPNDNDPVGFSTEVGKCPWNSKNRLVKIGIKARDIVNEDLPPANLVFLIDVSGSMYGANRLELVKSSMKLLVNQMRPIDRIGIVVYASNTRVALPSTSGENKQAIIDALDRLTAGGSTAGGAGIKLAYQTAEENFIKSGNNRIIMCTDGDFNVGVSSLADLKSLIEDKRKSGVYLSILGYGMGNYKDDKMQTLSEAGNGNHAYIDGMQEANKVLVSEFSSTMYTIGKDVKLQVEFNPLKVKSYRLVGYESRILEKEDFNDDKKDAGDMGAGHTVTAFYEIVPMKGNEKKNKQEVSKVDPLKYQATVATGSDELLTVKLRYKDPEDEKSKLISIPVAGNGLDDVSEDFRFASAVAMFGKILKDDEAYGASSLNSVIKLASSAYGEDEDGYRREFVRLVKLTQGIASNLSQR